MASALRGVTTRILASSLFGFASMENTGTCEGKQQMTAERNRKIKAILSKAFGKVSVKAGRGTASHWVTINIDYAPKDVEERRELTAKVWQLFKAAGITIGTYGYDDPGSDYGFGNTCHINFLQCRDVFNEGERVTWSGQIGIIKDRPYDKGGDWYKPQDRQGWPVRYRVCQICGTVGREFVGYHAQRQKRKVQNKQV